MAQGMLQGLEARVATVVAILALLLQLAVPPGFMVAETSHGPAVVICTGHGPLLADGAGHGSPGKSPGSKSSGVCPFAGHGGSGLPPMAAALSPIAYVFEREQTSTPGDLYPGRGLAAPPPPSHAPPLLLI
jgi:hypothetical protein